jgi:hypothetical protein
MDDENIKKKVLTLAQNDPEFRAKLFRLNTLRDQFTYPTTEVWMQLGPAMMEFMGDVGLMDEIHTQESFNELNEWILENVNELAFYVQQTKKVIPRHYPRPVGKIFLSWTVKNPRGRESLAGIKGALDYFNIAYFDYTEHELSGEGDLSDQIEEQIRQAVDSSSITIEALSATLGSKWIDWERYYIKKSRVLLRIVITLDQELVDLITMEPSEEQRVLRLDMSGGRWGLHRPEDFNRYATTEADTSYYQSQDYFLTCFNLGWFIRKRLDADNPSNWLKSLIDILSLRRIREAYEFVHSSRGRA